MKSDCISLDCEGTLNGKHNETQNRDGSVAFRVKVSAGVGADGRYIYRSATFTPPPNLSARKEAKAVQEFADDFERRVQEGLFVANDLTVDGLAERWMKTYCESS